MRLLLLPSLIFLAACGGGADRSSGRDTLTQRQKDSLTAQSALPGAQGVQGALNAQDTSAARQRTIDSIANNP